MGSSWIYDASFSNEFTHCSDVLPQTGVLFVCIIFCLVPLFVPPCHFAYIVFVMHTNVLFNYDDDRNSHDFCRHYHCLWSELYENLHCVAANRWERLAACKCWRISNNNLYIFFLFWLGFYFYIFSCWLRKGFNFICKWDGWLQTCDNLIFRKRINDMRLCVVWLDTEANWCCFSHHIIIIIFDDNERERRKTSSNLEWSEWSLWNVHVDIY